MIIIALTGILFLTTIIFIVKESFDLRKTEVVFQKIWRFNIYFGDFMRLFFVLPVFLLSFFYWILIVTFLPSYFDVFFVVLGVFAVIFIVVMYCIGKLTTR